MRKSRYSIQTILCMSVSAFSILAITSCNQDEVAWETTTSSVGADVADLETVDNRWRSYREGVISGLAVMTQALETTRKQTSVADKSELDRLTTRIDHLRSDIIAEFDVPRSEARAVRAGLESSFDTLRADVESLLTRLGHNPEEFRAWRSAASDP